MRPDTVYTGTYDPREFVELLAPLDLHPADDAECAAGRALAAEMISPAIASLETLRRVHARTGGAALFVQTAEGEVTGVTGILPVSVEGLRAMVEHRFNAKDPLDEHLCAPGEAMAAQYPWAFAAKTRRASAAVVQMTILLRERYPDIPFFTRAVTPAGAKVVRGRMGYSPYPGAPDDLLWNPARPPSVLSQERAA
jgi:hypothetical protein